MDINKIITLSDHPNGLDKLYDKLLYKSNIIPPLYQFVEVGVRCAATSLLFLHSIQNSISPLRPFLTIDPYGDKPYNMGDSIASFTYNDSMYAAAMKMIKDYCFDHNLFHCHFKLTSFDFMSIYDQISIWYHGQILKQPFGFVYLDGDHNVETVEKEVEWFSNRIDKVNGMIVIDDCEYIMNSDSLVLNHFLKKSEILDGRAFIDFSTLHIT